LIYCQNSVQFFIIKTLSVPLFLAGYVLDDVCHCRLIRNTTLHTNSTCGLLSTSRGPHQKVISFSFYLGNNSNTDPYDMCELGSSNNEYFDGIKLNFESVQKLYPGYSMRLYHNVLFNSRFGLTVFFNGFNTQTFMSKYKLLTK